MPARETEVEREAGACGTSVTGPQHCITCGDDADLMTVMAVDPARGLALCSSESGEVGKRFTVEIALVEPVAPGQRLLVHAGTAIARLDR